MSYVHVFSYPCVSCSGIHADKFLCLSCSVRKAKNCQSMNNWQEHANDIMKMLYRSFCSATAGDQFTNPSFYKSSRKQNRQEKNKLSRKYQASKVLRTLCRRKHELIRETRRLECFGERQSPRHQHFGRLSGVH